jgi:hypothetical protein
MDAKPILLARVHRGHTLDIQEKISLKLATITQGEYHVLVINSLRKDDVVLEVLNVKYINEITMQQLRTKLIQYLAE